MSTYLTKAELQQLPKGAKVFTTCYYGDRVLWSEAGIVKINSPTPLEFIRIDHEISKSGSHSSSTISYSFVSDGGVCQKNQLDWRVVSLDLTGISRNYSYP